MLKNGAAEGGDAVGKEIAERIAIEFSVSTLIGELKNAARRARRRNGDTSRRVDAVAAHGLEHQTAMNHFGHGSDVLIRSELGDRGAEHCPGEMIGNLADRVDLIGGAADQFA